MKRVLTTLFDHIVETVPVAELPVIKKTGITLAQAYRNAAAEPGLDEETAATYRSSAGILDWANSGAPHFSPMESDTIRPMLIELNGEIKREMFVNLEDRHIYIRHDAVDYSPLAGSFESVRAWIKDGDVWVAV
jgi:hypothetical protein